MLIRTQGPPDKIGMLCQLSYEIRRFILGVQKYSSVTFMPKLFHSYSPLSLFYSSSAFFILSSTLFSSIFCATRIMFLKATALEIP